MSNSLVSPAYKSKDTGTEILSFSQEIKNKDLIDLSESGLVTGKIINYSEDSFVFETENLMLPNFIFENFGMGSSICGLASVKFTSLNAAMRKSILNKFNRVISDPKKSNFIRDVLNIEREVTRLQSDGNSNMADILNEYFDNQLLKKNEINLSLLKDNDDTLYFLVKTKPIINFSSIFDEFTKAILYYNRLYRSKVGSEKLCFCPIETKIGDQFYSMIDLFNRASTEIRKLLVSDLIAIFEEETSQVFEDYLQEEMLNTGVLINRNLIGYFKNICAPVGRCALVKDLATGNPTLGFLSKDVKYIPQELNLPDFPTLFESQEELQHICKLQ